MHTLTNENWESFQFRCYTVMNSREYCDLDLVVKAMLVIKSVDYRFRILAFPKEKPQLELEIAKFSREGCLWFPIWSKLVYERLKDIHRQLCYLAFNPL